MPLVLLRSTGAPTLNGRTRRRITPTPRTRAGVPLRRPGGLIRQWIRSSHYRIICSWREFQCLFNRAFWQSIISAMRVRLSQLSIVWLFLRRAVTAIRQTFVSETREVTMPNGGAGQKPRGRTLAEFLDGRGQLLPAERKLLEACLKGEPASIAAASRPMRKTDENHIRAQFLRFLALGGDERAPVHEKGVHVCGAWIDHDVDLEACHVTAPITLDWCSVDGNINLLDAEIPCLFLDNTFAKCIDAERLRCAGSMHLNNATSVAGGVSMVGAQVGGDIDCDDTYFGDNNGTSLDCSGAEIRGSVFLGREGNNNRSLHAAGKVNFLGSRIHGSLLCNAAKFEGPVWIIGAHITGDLDFSLCNFIDGAERSEIILSRSEIEGRFFFRRVTGKADRIVMRATTVAFLGDDLDSWKIASQVFLDGFQYGRFIDAYLMDEPPDWTHHISPTDAGGRIEWLAREMDFKPHPWEQLIKVLRDIGHHEGAKKVAIAKQKKTRKSRRVPRVLHWLYGISCRYGYRPTLLILWAIGFAVAGAVLFKIAGTNGVMAPTDRHVFEEVRDIACRPEHGGNWTTCASLHRLGYPSFDPVLYSVDLILPVVATQQTKDWAPLTTEPCRDTNFLGLCKEHLPQGVISSTSGYWWPGGLFWLLARFETVLGWIFGLLFVAIVAGIIKKD